MYMITPYMEHDLTGLLENPNVHLNVPQIKCYMLQLLQGVRYLHCVSSVVDLLEYEICSNTLICRITSYIGTSKVR